jgi:hypothetical protein
MLVAVVAAAILMLAVVGLEVVAPAQEARLRLRQQERLIQVAVGVVAQARLSTQVVQAAPESSSSNTVNR